MKVSLYKNQRGFGAATIIILLVVVLAVAGGAYYFINKDKDVTDNAGSNSGSNAQLAAECSKAINDKDLCRFASSGSLALNRNVVMTANMVQDGANMTMVIRYDGSGNSHTTTTGLGGEGDTEAISLNGAYYMRSGGETWMKLPSAGGAEDVLEDTAPDFDFEAANVNDMYVKEGKEACGNLTCFKYTWKDAGALDGTYTFWFDDKEYKLRKFVTSADGGTFEATVSYENVTISEPSPVQEFNF